MSTMFKGAFSGLRKFLAAEDPLKMMKNAFCSTSKALFVLKLSIFLPWLYVHEANGLLRTVRLISNFTTSQPGQQTIVIHILSNISKNKGNQAMKFGQLIECNTRKIFLE